MTPTGAVKQSSKLLINESPLQVLPSLAVAVGLNEAIFLQQLQYWLVTSKHEHDGRKWIYNSAGEWTKQFPFWSEATIRRVVNSLRDRKVILVRSDLNKAAFDRTLWYSIDYDAIEEIVTSSDEIVTSSDQLDHTTLSSCIDGSDQLDQSNTNRLPETTQKSTAVGGKPAATAINPDVAKVWAAWQANMPGMITPVIKDSVNELLAEYSAAEIVEAIAIACRKNKRHLDYIKGILAKGAFSDAPKPSGGDYRPSNAASNRQAVSNVFAKLRAQQEVNGHG